MERMIRFLRSFPVLLALMLAFAAPAEAAMRVKVLADSMRAVNTPQGETAKADGNVTIEVVGEVRIRTASAQLIKGADGKLERVVFPGEVKIENLRPDSGDWKSTENKGGFYDLRTMTYTELATDGYYEF